MSTESWSPPLVQCDTLAQFAIGSTSATAKLTLRVTSDRQLKCSGYSHIGRTGSSSRLLETWSELRDVGLSTDLSSEQHVSQYDGVIVHLVMGGIH
jgi:hypothetical protein